MELDAEMKRVAFCCLLITVLLQFGCVNSSSADHSGTFTRDKNDLVSSYRQVQTVLRYTENDHVLLRHEFEILVNGILEIFGCTKEDDCQCAGNITETVYHTLNLNENRALHLGDLSNASVVILYTVVHGVRRQPCIEPKSTGYQYYLDWLYGSGIHDSHEAEDRIEELVKGLESQIERDKDGHHDEGHRDGDLEEDHEEHEEDPHEEHEEEHHEEHEEEHEENQEEYHEGHSDHYHAEEQDHDHLQSQCFGLATIVGDIHVNKNEDLVQAAVTMISHLYLGFLPDSNCTRSKHFPTLHEFLHDIYVHAGVEKGQYFDLSSLEVLLSKLGIGLESNHLQEDSRHAHDHRRKRSAHRTRRAAGHEHEQDDHDNEDGDHENVSASCYSAEDLLTIHGIRDADAITEAQMQLLCPALLQQQLTGVCSNTKKGPSGQKVSDLQRYGYGTLAVFIISLCALVGLLLAPCFNKSCFYLIIAFLAAMAVGTLLGDSLLHLLPQAYHLHAAGGHAGHGDHEGGVHVEFQDYTAKSLGMLAAIFGFFVMESLLEFGRNKNESKYSPKHPDIQMNGNHVDSAHVQNKEYAGDDEKGHLTEESALCCGTKPIAWMILLGDAVHNFADGLAIGAAFSQSLAGGLSTSVAVFCHELPHEIGDFAVLVESGLPLCKAAFFNFVSAVSAFAGLYIGLAVTSDQESQVWILTVAGGMFLYIGLASMIPELIEMQKKKNGWVVFIVQMLGILFGIGLLTMLSLFEENIAITL